MTPWHHALSSAKKFGGVPADYSDIHHWFDETKAFTGDWTHRALRHHALGVETAIATFGPFIELEGGIKVATKLVAEQHIMEDCGYIPTVANWLEPLRKRPEEWMLKVKTRARDLDTRPSINENSCNTINREQHGSSSKHPEISVY